MSDLVEFYRNLVPPQFGTEAPEKYGVMIFASRAKETADELERLREALRLYQCKCEDGQCEVAFDNDERGELCGMPARAALEEGKE